MWKIGLSDIVTWDEAQYVVLDYTKYQPVQARNLMLMLLLALANLDHIT